MSDHSLFPLVPGELVHRTAADEVLVAGADRLAPDRFLVRLRWRRSHRTFVPAATARHSPLLVAESIRQACIYLAIRFLGVPPETRLVIRELHFAVDPGSAPPAVTETTEAALLVRVVRTRRDEASGQLVALQLEGTLLADARVFATAGGSARLFSPADYTALRAAATTPAAPTGPAQPGPEQPPLTPPRPGLVGVARPGDVVLAAAPDGRWAVRPADPCHPFFYDHPVDHVPGMVLAEAARQYALLRLGDPGLRLTGLRMRPLAFAETGPLLTCAAPGAVSAAPFPFELRQSGRCVVEGELALARA